MKNNYSKLFILLIISFCCLQEVALAATGGVPNNGINPTILKFLYAMGGVVASSLILFVGLSIYNKIRQNKYQIPEVKKTNSQFSTPKTVDESINLFINQNKL